MREGAYETCPKHGAYEPCDDSPSCGECRDDQVATAKEDVLRAAKGWRRCRTAIGEGASRAWIDANERLVEAVDRWQKLEGSR